MESKKFIEVLNWNKYQERMPANGANWFKLHCSLANCDAFQALDYKDQMLLIGIWMHAAESGKNIMPADPKYLFRNIRLCKDIPDIQPLIEAKDAFGRPNPFIRYCDTPVLDDNPDAAADAQKTSSGSGKKRSNSSNSSRSKKARSKQVESGIGPLYETAVRIAAYYGYISGRKLQNKLRIGNKRANDIIHAMRHNNVLGGFVGGRGWECLTAVENCNTEKSRVDKKREDTESLRIPEERKEREEQNGLDRRCIENEDRTEEQNPSRADTEQINETCETVGQEQAQKPVNPMESEAGADEVHHVPKQPRSAFRGGNPQRIGSIISGVFREHWQDPDAEAFGWEIVKALGYPVDRENEFSKSEWGAFASWWYRLRCTLALEVRDNIRDIAIKKAKFLNSPKAKSAKNKSAVWFKIMAGELAAKGIKWGKQYQSALKDNAKGEAI